MMLQGIFPGPLLPWQETQAPSFPAATAQTNGENENTNGKRRNPQIQEQSKLGHRLEIYLMT